MHELLDGAIRTLEEVLMPELATPWAKSSAIGLLGQLRYARARADGDDLAEQNAALQRCLAGLSSEFSELRKIVEAAATSGDASRDLREQAGKLLVFAVGNEGAATDAVRERLRPLLVEHLQRDLAASTPMLHAFLAAGSVGSAR